MDVHWEQACGPVSASRRTVLSLRGLGGFSCCAYRPITPQWLCWCGS
ncbi:hypothetical protein [Comamonas sp. Z3]